MRDLYHKLETEILALPQVVSADLTPANGVELNDCEGVNFEAIIGADGATLGATDKLDIILEDSDDDSTYAAVTNADYVLGLTPDASGIVATIDGATDDEQSYKCGYLGPKRYAQIRADVTGTVSLPVCLLATKGYKNREAL